MAGVRALLLLVSSLRALIELLLLFIQIQNRFRWHPKIRSRWWWFEISLVATNIWSRIILIGVDREGLMEVGTVVFIV